MQNKFSQKIPRGQMVYAPISSGQKISKSPFTDNNKPISIKQSHQNNTTKKQNNQPYSKPLTLNNSQQITILRTRSQSQLQEYIQILQHQNSSLKSKQQIYIAKLIRLQQGLQKQHEEFMNLQELYTELFNSYKQKQEEIAELQLRYKETERDKERDKGNLDNTNNIMIFSKKNSQIKNHNHNQNNHYQNQNNQNNIDNSTKSMDEDFKYEITQLILQNKRLNQTNQKLILQLNYSKSKQKLNESRQMLQQKVFEDINEWQKQNDQQKAQRIKLQYQNKYLKMRIEDLEKNNIELQKIVSLKQNQIMRMREQRMNFRRQSSEKVLNKSPPKSGFDSSRSKNNQNKKLTQLIQTLQRQNNRLRQQNLICKEKLKGTILSKQQHQSLNLSNINRDSLSISRKLQYEDKPTSQNQFGLKGFNQNHNENYNSQNFNENYFSFSREKQQKYSDYSDLPTFPMDLEIEGIIQKHKGNIKDKIENKQKSQQLLQEA